VLLLHSFQPGTAMKKRHEIDGLRALAVVPVIVFHAGLGMFGGGFVGVDVFFVISGYLITSLILLEQQAGGFSILRFYERRARRILPALFLMMFCCLPFAWAWMMPEQMKAFSRSIVHVCLFISNMLFGRDNGYFDMASELKPLMHTWSLAIEEQFYVFFPLLLMLTARWKKKNTTTLIAAIACVSLSISYWKAGTAPAAAFYFFPARIWELFIGALVAIYLLEKPILPLASHRWLANILSLAGALMIVSAMCLYNENTPYPSLYALVPTIGSALIILYASPQTYVGKILCSKIFTGIGLISYSAYLWHYPIFSFAHISGVESFSPSLAGALILLTFMLAYGSWKFVEQPFRNPATVNRKTLVRTLGFAFMLLITIGTAGRITKGYEKFYLDHRLSAAERETYQFIKRHTDDDSLKLPNDNSDCNFKAPDIDDAFNTRFQACYKKYGKATIVLGDSHAINIYNALYKTGFQEFLVGAVKVGCRINSTQPKCQYEDFATFVEKNPERIDKVIFHQSGSYLLADYLGREDSTDIFAEGRRYNIQYGNISAITEYLAGISQHTRVVWLGPFIEARFDLKNIRKITKDGFAIKENRFAIFDELDKALAESLQKYSAEFSYIALNPALQITPDFLKQGDCLTYRDMDHFSACGEDIIGPRIQKVLEQ
jgi:peptidoglycan/LPS O-acetylase OafA/YrhL